MRAVPTVLMINPRLNMACRRLARRDFFMFSSLLSTVLGNRKAGMAVFHAVMPAIDYSFQLNILYFCQPAFHLLH